MPLRFGTAHASAVRWTTRASEVRDHAANSVRDNARKCAVWTTYANAVRGTTQFHCGDQVYNCGHGPQVYNRRRMPRPKSFSAFEDKRFEEVTLEEVPDLHCSLSIIKSLEEIKDYRDWTVGTNGIRIHFEQNGKKMWAFYLPEVPKEKGELLSVSLALALYTQGY